ncbi:MAG: cytidine deaminase [Ruminococcaceae bacterium]|nr:cytidine deaminase [Oscillospiraceae bacterium]
MTDLELMRLAEDARAYSYTPYSNFAVGAALLTKSGKVYTGCNIESASYTPTNCAERTAVFKAVSEGERDFAAIAVIGGPAGEKGRFCAPCGVCRQVLREFCTSDFRILLGTVEEVKVFTLEDLLPTSFGPSDLKGV